MPAVAELLDDDITWYESTAGMEGVYHGRDQVLAFLGQVFQQAGMQMSVSIHDILANDDHAVILHESTPPQPSGQPNTRGPALRGRQCQICLSGVG